MIKKLDDEDFEKLARLADLMEKHGIEPTKPGLFTRIFDKIIFASPWVVMGLFVLGMGNCYYEYYDGDVSDTRPCVAATGNINCQGPTQKELEQFDKDRRRYQ